MNTLRNKIKSLWIRVINCFATNKKLREELTAAKHELGREVHRSTGLWDELKAMRGERKDLDVAINQMNASVDALMIATALKYGKRSTGGDIIKLTLPEVDANKLLTAYEISADKVKGKYVATVKPRAQKPKVVPISAQEEGEVTDGKL